jgi:polysaccharide export outer membrane protein
MLLTALPSAAQTEEANPYRIGPKDLIEIKVFEVPELNIERRVEENGTLALPLIGEVEAEGLTPNELSERLRVLLEAKYIQRASVAVAVREYRSRPISVIGAVRQPGALAFSGRWTLLEAIAAAGGLAENHGSSIYVLRSSDNGLSDQIRIDVRELMVEARPEANIPVFAGDLINIPATIEITVFCLGAVARPGALTFKSNERLTLLAAIARAGGLSERASHSIIIRRTDRDGREMEIAANYKRIVAGKQADPSLEPNDVVVVKESFF